MGLAGGEPLDPARRTLSRAPHSPGLAGAQYPRQDWRASNPLARIGGRAISTKGIAMLTYLSCCLALHYARKYNVTWLIPIKRLRTMPDAILPL